MILQLTYILVAHRLCNNYYVCNTCQSILCILSQIITEVVSGPVKDRAGLDSTLHFIETHHSPMSKHLATTAVSSLFNRKKSQAEPGLRERRGDVEKKESCCGMS